MPEEGKSEEESRHSRSKYRSLKDILKKKDGPSANAAPNCRGRVVEDDGPVIVLHRKLPLPFLFAEELVSWRDQIFCATQCSILQLDRQGRPIMRLMEHTGWILALAVSHELDLMCSGGYDRSIRVWGFQNENDPRKLECLHSIDVEDTVKCLLFAKDWGNVLIASAASRIVLWRFIGNSCRPIREHVMQSSVGEEIISMAFCKDRLYTAHCNNIFLVWSSDYECVLSLQVPWIRQLRTIDDTLFAYIFSSKSSNLGRWRADFGIFEYVTSDSILNGISDWNGYIATAAYEHALCLWDPKTLKQVIQPIRWEQEGGIWSNITMVKIDDRTLWSIGHECLEFKMYPGRWKCENHLQCPRDFRRQVKTLLLCHYRSSEMLRQTPKKSSKKNLLKLWKDFNHHKTSKKVSLLGLLPNELLFQIIEWLWILSKTSLLQEMTPAPKAKKSTKKDHVLHKSKHILLKS